MEWSVLILTPILANVLLAAFLFAKLPETLGTEGVHKTPLPSPPSLDGLPESRLTSILEVVQSATGHHYSCEGPWRTSDGLSNWSCRTDEALVVLMGADAQRIIRLDATWFGFDPALTDLPAWAAAAQADSVGVHAARSWVAGQVGGDASTEISTVRYAVGGARGALNLRIEAHVTRP